MRQNYPECLRRVLLSEGGYTNNPRDPGGPTNWGITIMDARDYWKPDASADDVRAMPRSVAEEIYKPKYWDALACDDLPSGVDYTVFDYGVNSGIKRAGSVLRASLGLPTNDWHIDAEVLKRAAEVDAVRLIDSINTERMAFLMALPTWGTFRLGWSRRVVAVKAFSEHLAKAPPVPAPAHPEQSQLGGKSYSDEPVDTPSLWVPQWLKRSPEGPQPATVPQNNPIGSPVVRYSDGPATPMAPQQTPTQGPSKWHAVSGWASGLVGGSGALQGLQQANDYMSELSDFKWNLSTLNVSGVLHWTLHHPGLLFPVAIIALGVWLWEDHQKYKRLLAEAQKRQ